MGYFVEFNVIIEYEFFILVKECWEILMFNFWNGFLIKFVFCIYFFIIGVFNELKILKYNYYFFLKVMIKYLLIL